MYPQTYVYDSNTAAINTPILGLFHQIKPTWFSLSTRTKPRTISALTLSRQWCSGLFVLILYSQLGHFSTNKISTTNNSPYNISFFALKNISILRWAMITLIRCHQIYLHCKDWDHVSRIRICLFVINTMIPLLWIHNTSQQSSRAVDKLNIL